MRKVTIFLLFCILFAGIAKAQISPEYPYLLSPDEIMKTAMDSKISYEFNAVSSSSDVGIVYPDLSVVYLKNDGEENPQPEIIKNEEANEIFKTAKEKFADDDFDSAISLLLKASQLDSTSSILFTLLGRCYFEKKDFLNAKENYKKATELNYYNFMAHQYLAELYGELVQYNEAVNSIIIAHILNRNNSEIKELMIDYMDETGDDWNDFEIQPIYTVFKDTVSGKIKINVTTDWLIYSAAIALWRYEPGFAEGKLGKNYSQSYAKFAQEACGFVASILRPEFKEYIYVLKDKTLEPFTYYELILPREPLVVYSMTKDNLEKIKNIIIKYH